MARIERCPESVVALFVSGRGRLVVISWCLDSVPRFSARDKGSHVGSHRTDLPGKAVAARHWPAALKEEIALATLDAGARVASPGVTIWTRRKYMSGARL